MSIRDTFCELTRVLGELQPPTDPKFLSPATEDAILAAEAALGLPFPADLKELLLCANGQDFPMGDAYPIFPMIRFKEGVLGQTSMTWLNSAPSIVEITGYQREEYSMIKDDGPFETFGPATYHDQVIGFTSTENSDSLIIDLAPAEGGSVGQVVMVRTQPFQLAVLAPNLGEFLQLVLDGYQSGRFQYGIGQFPCSWGDP
jgi:cell wall assembly regulator SMI1